MDSAYDGQVENAVDHQGAGQQYDCPHQDAEHHHLGIRGKGIQKGFGGIHIFPLYPRFPADLIHKLPAVSGGHSGSVPQPGIYFIGLLRQLASPLRIALGEKYGKLFGCLVPLQYAGDRETLLLAVIETQCHLTSHFRFHIHSAKHGGADRHFVLPLRQRSAHQPAHPNLVCHFTDIGRHDVKTVHPREHSCLDPDVIRKTRVPAQGLRLLLR